MGSEKNKCPSKFVEDTNETVIDMKVVFRVGSLTELMPTFGFFTICLYKNEVRWE